MRKKSAAQRILAMFLTVAMVAALFPATVLVNAVSATENPILVDPITGNPVGVVSTENGTTTLKPFYLVNWDRGSETNYFSNVYWMPYTWTQEAWYNAETDTMRIGMYFKGKSSTDPATIAQWMYEEFSSRPAGTRYINLAAMGSVFRLFVKDAIDFEDGIRLVSAWVDDVLGRYKALGGELDGIATDLEYNYYTSFYIQSHFCVKYTEDGVTKEPRNLDILQDIVRNERVYQAKIRPQLVELEKQGLFQFYTNKINPETGLPDDLSTAVGKNSGNRVPIPISELTTINRYSDDGGITSCGSTWGAVLNRHIADSINRAALEPMLKHYPNALLSDYSRADTFSWHKGYTDDGSTGTAAGVGNTSNGVYYGSSFSEYFYASYSGSATRQLYDKKPAGQNAAVFEPTDPYSRFIMDINNQKRIVASTLERDPNGHTNVWVPYFNYASNTKSYGGTAYFSELMYHLGLTNPEPFLGYIIESEVKNKGKNYPDDPELGSFKYALGITNELLAELTRVAGASDRKPIVTPIEWDNGFMLSGMYAGGRNIWRLTPDTTKVSVEAFKVDGKKAPTFTVNGVTITFPQGRIIEDADITRIGSCGYWIETPANVTPVITKGANHIAENPAFGEDFEGFITGAFTGSADSVDKTLHAAGYRPDTYWTASGTAEIVEKNGNKTLTMSGTTTLTNQGVPAQVTAGDTYANKQVWEVTVTMPSKFAGTIKLLGGSTSTEGFQITSSGVVRYPTKLITTYYTNMGLTLTAGKTYTFKRVLDFSAKTCDYYVYDANGSLLKSLTGKTLLNVTAPVSKVYITTSSVTNPITIDNYKLYATGVTTNLHLYEIVPLTQLPDQNGIARAVTDTTAARTSATAYRVSWMNASNEYKKAVLKNKTTGAVIEEVLMAPGDSGYFTGTVNATPSAPVTFLLEQVAAAAPTQPDYENGDFSWPSYAENLGIVCYVGDQGYATVEAALAAAKDGQTVNLLKNVQLTSTAVVNTDVNINNNGYTITLADDFTGDSAFQVVAGGTLNWSEGLVLNAGSKTAITVTGGTLNVTGGTVATTGTAILVKQDADQSAIVVNVTGGSVQGEKAFLHTNANKESSKNVTATITATAVTGVVETNEPHFELQSSEGVYTLHGHTYTIIPGYAATCTDPGLTDGAEYTCCNKTLPQEVIPALGGEHNWETAPCSTAQVCTKCGMTGVAGEANHTYGAGVVTPVTCTTDGYTTYTCSACGYSYTDNVIPAPGHTNGAAVKEKEVAETCTTDGSYDEVTYCTVCSKETSRKTVILTAPGHVPGEVEVENEVAMTCTDDGSYDNVVYCAVCLSEISRQTVIIPAPVGGHDSDGYQREVISVGTCTVDDYYIDVVYCTACGFEHSRQEFYTPAPGHKYVVGSTHITCENCDYNKEIGTATITVQTGTKTDTDTDGTVWKPNLSVGMAPVYGTNDANGVVSAGNANNWTIKIEWNVGDKLTITLRNAYIVNELRENSYRTMVIGGTADIVMQLEGENTILGNPTSATNAAKGGESLRVTTTGSFTIRGNSKADSLKIENVVANCLTRAYGPLTIENATVKLNHKQTSNTYAVLFMPYGSDAYKDKTDLTVLNSDLSLTGGRYNVYGIVMGGTTTTGSSYSSANDGDILFKDSKIYVYRSGSSGWSKDAAFIKNGANGKFTIDNCDATLYGSAYLYRYAPEIINCTTARLAGYQIKEADYAITPGAAIDQHYTTIKTTHICQNSAPTIEIVSKGECCARRETVTYCSFCGERTILVEENISTKAHTPGAKVELVDQRTAATRSASGKYVFQQSCTVCGETWTEEEAFGAALLHYLTSNLEGTDSALRNFNTWPNSGNKTAEYYPNIVMNPGDAPRYFVTENSHATFTNNYYVAELTDTDKIAAGQWNMKLEYPLYGTPVLTLKGAKIINNAGLWFGIGAYMSIAPMKIVVAEDSEISNNMEYCIATDGQNVSAIRSWGTGDLTITGPGKLTIKSNLYGGAIINAKGSITFDHVDVDIVKNDTMLRSRTCSGIYSSAGSITIDGGSIKLFTYCPEMYEKDADGNYVLNDEGKKINMGYRGFTYGIYAKKDMTIKGGADVNITATLSGNSATSDGIYGGGTVTISESSVLISHGGYAYGDAMNYGTALVLDYANGYNARYSGSKFSYNAATGEVTYPSGSAISGTPTTDHLSAYMFKISPKTTVAKFEGTRVGVEDDLILEFALDTGAVANTGYALITRTRVNPDGTTSTDEPIKVYLNQVATESYGTMTCYVIPYTGIAAKEMHDAVTVVVYDADGKVITETKTDSVYDYAVRMMRKTDDAKLKTVLVDLLNYGTMAQVQFMHNDKNLANTVLNPTEWGIATETFEKAENPAAVVTGTGYIGTAFELKSNIAMLMGIHTTQLGAGSYAMVYVGDSAEGIRVDAVDEENNIAVFTFNGLVAAKGRTNVTWKFYRAGEDATTAEPTLIVTDSMINYVSRMVEEYPYLAELMHYCDAAAAYFDTLN